jgi:hypothetical protein
MIKTNIETIMGKEVVTIFENALKLNNTLRYKINDDG